VQSACQQRNESYRPNKGQLQGIAAAIRVPTLIPVLEPLFHHSLKDFVSRNASRRAKVE
jgi:hypothetical protein